MKFNPEVHSSVISNYRDAFRNKYKIESSLSDRTIWIITENWVGLEGGSSAEDEAILEEMFEKQGAV